MGIKKMLRGAAAALLGLASLGCSPPPAQPDGIRVQRVEFHSQGQRIVGDLFVARDAGEARSGPGVVVTGAWMTVRQQMSTRYARELAERGYTALVFDYRGWGESGGERRQYEDPGTKIADTAAAIDYLAARPEVDESRVGALGICASSGYVVHAAVDSPRVRSVALAAPWLHDRDVVLQTYGGEAGVAALMDTARMAEAEYRHTGRQQFVPAASLTDPRAIMFGAPYYTDSGRGMIAAWRNEADPAFWTDWLTFDGVAPAARLRQPLFMVHSQAAAIPQGAQRFYRDVTAAKGQLWLDDVSQFDFYDAEGPVRAATDAIAEHFDETLRPAK